MLPSHYRIEPGTGTTLSPCQIALQLVTALQSALGERQGGKKHQTLHLHSPVSERAIRRQSRTTGTQRHSAPHLIGSNLLVNVRLLPDSVFQVRDVGLEPVPAADDGGTVCCPSPLCPSPPATTQRGRGIILSVILITQTTKIQGELTDRSKAPSWMAELIPSHHC